MGIIEARLAEVILNPPAPTWRESEYAGRLAWANDSADNGLASYPGPGWQDDDPDRYAPSPEEAAELLGWEIGLSGEGEPYRCDDFSISTEAFFAARNGWVRGRHERDERAWREQVEYDSWLRELAEEREAELMLEDARGWHEAERVAAVGSIASRNAD